jgi:hypothetical protein
MPQEPVKLELEIGKVIFEEIIQARQRREFSCLQVLDFQ